MIATIPLEGLPTFIGNTRSQLKTRTLLFRYLAIINLTLGTWYIIWRTTQSVNWHAWWIALPLLGAEIYGFLGGLMFIIGLWRPLVRQVRSLAHLVPALPRKEWPTVDVFIACYNEPVEMVQETARAALAMDYPAEKLRVYVLDDGNTPAMRTMSEQLCLKDLQTPALQTYSKTLQMKRQQLVEQKMALEAARLELEQTDDRADLPLLKKITRLLSPQQIPLDEQISTALEELNHSIHEQEIALTELGRCRYIARPKPKGRAHHAKAGNINYAIFSGKTTGEFILTLDADHIPKSHFLQRVLPHFFQYNLSKGRYESNKKAFVQTPQSFYNLPSDDPFCHRAGLFYGPIQQGKDGLNSAFYTGTNALLRREALVTMGLTNFSETLLQDSDRLSEFELIGGLSSSSITEDMNTAMRLHATGWQSAYHDEVLAVGLAPDDLGSTLKQRLRWAQGTLQVLQTENPLFKPGLSFWQRLQYFQTMYSYFSGFATLILLVCPIIYFFTGIIPVEAFGSDFVVHFLPVFIINRLTFIAISWGIPAAEVWRSEQYSVALFPLFIQAVLSVWFKQSLTFQVTPKHRQSGIYLKMVWPQLSLFFLLVMGILWGGVQLWLGYIETPSTYWVNVAWSCYSLCLLWSIIRASFWSPTT
ncbi:MAG: glycosyltransferase family 2 protein [Cyanobacteria bacterium J06560_6]